MSPDLVYFPAIIRSKHESPIDALVALGLPRDECMDLVAASWHQPGQSLVAQVDGGRAVAVLPLPGGRWAACNAYLEHGCATPGEAARRLEKLCKRGRQGLVGAFRREPAGTMAE